MKHFQKATWALPLCVLLIAGCEKELNPKQQHASATLKSEYEPEEINPEEVDPEAYGEQRLNVHYAGQIYQVSANLELDGDGQLTGEAVESDDLAAIREIVQDLGNIGVLVKNETDIYLYANEEQLNEITEILFEQPGEEVVDGLKDLEPGDYSCWPHYQMYRHINYSTPINILKGNLTYGQLGGSQPTTTWNSSYVFGMPYVGNQNNDQVSSIRLKGGTFFSPWGPMHHMQYVTVFKHANYQPVSYGIGEFTFWADGCYFGEYKDLRKWYIWQLFFFGENWNDEISSYKAYYNFHY